MSRPPLDSIPIDTNMTTAKRSHLDLTPVGKKKQDHKPLTQPMKSSKCNGIEHVPEDPKSEPPLSDSSPNESYSPYGINAEHLEA